MGEIELTMEQTKRSRRFILASIALLAGVAGLFLDKMDGTVFNFLVGTVLTAIGATEVGEKAFGRSSN